MSAQFRGVLSGEQQVIKGTWSQGERSATLTLTPVEEAAANESASTTSSRPQHPEKPYPYRTEEVTFKSDAGGVTLAGTLSMPDEEGPHPAVVLLQGSGENGRDYAYRGHKFFLVLADHLTRHGIAVLRYDLRGVDESEGRLSGASLEDLARDAASALRFLKERRSTEAGSVGLIGHSMGGMIAPWIHGQFEETAFLGLLAPLSLPGHQVLSQQRARIADAAGASAAEVDSIRKQSRRVFEILRSDRDSADVASQLQPILREGGAQNDRLQLKIEANTSPWFRDFARYDPRPALQQVEVPVLAFFGGGIYWCPLSKTRPRCVLRLRTAGLTACRFAYWRG
ncbi:alpha/beta hydrolase family protein [Salinibacter ruber]|uniref:alpha/beta hydrolase family protein n=1 Tax=Salinibacter ruber TaxID=146919 RepID=UPI002167E8F2|nr:alpha/beta hydrolase [Salinibacter ruber]MCS3703732.1 pimeloyl-ACP methyl ester carboxylesterase [Salinibacter ruber]